MARQQTKVTSRQLKNVVPKAFHKFGWKKKKKSKLEWNFGNGGKRMKK